MADNYQNTNIGNLNTANANFGRKNLFVHNGNNVEPSKQLLQNEQENLSSDSMSNSHSRLNALDSTILESESYLNIEDETLRNEYKISKLENSISEIDDKISKAIEIDDTYEVDVLEVRKQSVQKELDVLNNRYKNSDFTNKLSGEISNIFKFKPVVFPQVITFIKRCLSKYFLSFFSSAVRSGNEVKIALSKLETLNKNVDELINHQAPYGEKEDKYEKLTNYLNSANVINYQISQTVKGKPFFDTINSIDFEKVKMNKNNSNFGKMTGNK